MTREKIVKLAHDAGLHRNDHTSEQRIDACLKFAAALADQPATVPEGFVLVPVEPTPEMLAATSWPGCAKTDYSHMLAAAPKPEQQEAPQLDWSDFRHPPHVLGEQQEAPELTDEEIGRLLMSMIPSAVRVPRGWIEFARAVIAAHEAKRK